MSSMVEQQSSSKQHPVGTTAPAIVSDYSSHAVVLESNPPPAVDVTHEAPTSVPAGEAPAVVPTGCRRSVRMRPRLSVDTSKVKGEDQFYFPGCGNTLQTCDGASSSVLISLVKSGFVEDVVTPLHRREAHSGKSWPFLRHKDPEPATENGTPSSNNSAPLRRMSTFPLSDERGSEGDQSRRVTFAPPLNDAATPECSVPFERHSSFSLSRGNKSECQRTNGGMFGISAQPLRGESCV